MKITLLGHASLLIETKKHKILMDPVLGKTFEKGFAKVFPERKINLNRLPTIDILIISHIHLDHFDIETLSSLSKKIKVFIPKDQLMKHFLEMLGYENICILDEMTSSKLDELEIFTTRSELRVPEFGIVFADDTGVLWNQVDSSISFKTLANIKQRFKQIDLLIAPWQPFLEINFQNNDSIVFPYAAYSHFLAIVTKCSPKAVLPGANGFCANRQEGLNQIFFPVSREQFCKDILLACPKVRNVLVGDPGDVLKLESNETILLKEKSDLVTKLNPQSYRHRLDFCPVDFDSKLKDRNPKRISQKKLRSEITNILENQFGIFIRKNIRKIFKNHHKWKVIYQLKVVFPRSEVIWSVDFSSFKPVVRRIHLPDYNLATVITASSFYDIIKHEVNWGCIEMGGEYRSFSRIYSIHKSEGLKTPNSRLIIDPLKALFPEKEISYDMLYNDVKKYLKQNNQRDQKKRKTGS